MFGKGGRLSVFLLCVGVVAGCSREQESSREDPHYLDALCGSWTEQIVLKAPDGTRFAELESTWTCRYDPDRDVYRAEGEVPDVDGSPCEFIQEYTPVSDTESLFENMDLEGNVTSGRVVRIDENKTEQIGYYGNGQELVRSVSVMSNHTMTTETHYFDDTGQEYMTANSTAVRQN